MAHGIETSYAPLVQKQSHHTSPALGPLRDFFNATGYDSLPAYATSRSIFLRGSTASLITDAGALKMRHAISDVDFIALSDDGKMFYYVKHVPVVETEDPVEADVLTIPIETLRTDIAADRAMFVPSKLLHLGWPIVGDDVYHHLKIETFAGITQRVVAQNEGHLVAAPSLIARKIVELDIAAEPWRHSSYRTAFVGSPYRERNIAQLMRYVQLGVESLVESHQARRLVDKDATTDEPLYEICTDKVLPRLDSRERWRTFVQFVKDQSALQTTVEGHYSKSQIGYRFLLKFIEVGKDLMKPRDLPSVFAD